MRKNLYQKQKDPDMSKKENVIKKPIAIGIWAILALIAGA